ncbi:hypothetical protein NDI45_11225 [Leptolyngbya sp. GB1-A1]
MFFKTYRLPMPCLENQAIIPADAIARAIAFAIEQPEDVDVNEIIVRPIGQSG